MGIKLNSKIRSPGENTVKKDMKKLALNRETLRWLDEQRLLNALGGGPTADCSLGCLVVQPIPHHTLVTKKGCD
jgi:hypothetical protein